MTKYSASSVERVPESSFRRAIGKLFSSVLSVVGISLLAASASAGDITVLGASGLVYIFGDDYSYPSGAKTTIFSDTQSTTQLPANLSLSNSGSDGIVTDSSSGALSTSYTLSSSGDHMTADMTAMGQTSDTGAENYQAKVSSQTVTYFSFLTAAPTLLTYSLSGYADLVVPDPSGFDRVTYVTAGMLGNVSFPTIVEYAPTTFSISGHLYLTAGEYLFAFGQLTYDLQNPYYPGSYSEATYGSVHLDLQSVPEPSSICLLALAVIPLAAVYLRRIPRSVG